jgi:hypothetical protein
VRFVQAEASRLAVAVLCGAGELAEAVLVGDADLFQVAEDIGGEGEKGIRQQRLSFGCRFGTDCWRSLIPYRRRPVGCRTCGGRYGSLVPGGVIHMEADPVMAAGEVVSRSD